jgi:hypothetical protein
VISGHCEEIVFCWVGNHKPQVRGRCQSGVWLCLSLFSNFLVFFLPLLGCAPFTFFFFLGGGGLGSGNLLDGVGGFSFICGDFSCKIEFC